MNSPIVQLSESKPDTHLKSHCLNLKQRSLSFFSGSSASRLPTPGSRRSTPVNLYNRTLDWGDRSGNVLIYGYIYA
ncbi:hypothetical protein [Egbenema bharatensis]|uniref:hypothetical protein n=1 Tax=Egbenema bharatensis TaxID=3463334 RepID=UPI003A8B1357